MNGTVPPLPATLVQWCANQTSLTLFPVAHPAFASRSDFASNCFVEQLHASGVDGEVDADIDFGIDRLNRMHANQR